MKTILPATLLAIVGAMLVPVVAQEADPIGMTPSPDDVRGTIKKPSYSPYAGRNFPTKVFWGDTHVHTNNSLDARGFDVELGDEVWKTLQERAYTSPIWYQP